MTSSGRPRRRDEVLDHGEAQQRQRADYSKRSRHEQRRHEVNEEQTRSSSCAAFHVSVLTFCLVLVLPDDDDDDDDVDHKNRNDSTKCFVLLLLLRLSFLVLSSYDDNDDDRGDSTNTEAKSAFYAKNRQGSVLSTSMS